METANYVTIGGRLILSKVNPMKSITRVLAALAVVCCGALGACGQKGPLYLPGNPSEIQPQAPQQDQPEEDEDGAQPDASS